MQVNLNGLLDFVSFTHEIRKIKRSMWIFDEEVFENDSEHGYQLALTALYIIEANKLNLDPYKCMGIALVHDILEVHAGDTPVFASEETKASQSEREQEAIQQLKQQWTEMELMHALIDEYEHCNTPESKFVYALDKLVPMCSNYVDGGRNWQKNGITLDKILAVKAGKVDVDPTIAQYYEDIVALLRNKPELFE